MTITQTLQDSPAKVNELLGKLLEAPPGTAKAREKLFSELRSELETQGRLEQEHLFPVLEKHEETRGLVADARNDAKRALALLGELERTPRDNENFGKKVAELRAAFQQHLRDERKDLLPAVRKALADEESQSKPKEGERAALEDTQAVREAASLPARGAETASDTSKLALQAGGAMAEAGAQAGAEITRESTRQAAELTKRTASSVTGILQRYDEASRPVGAAVRTLSVLPAFAADTAREVNGAWVDWLNRSMETTARASQELARSTTPLQFAEAQSRFVQDSLQAMIETGNRLAQISLRSPKQLIDQIEDRSRGAERG
jgi:hypothetical protein